MIEAIKDARSGFFPHICHSNIWTFIAKIRASLVSRPSGIESAIVSQDLEGDHLQLMKNTDQDMEDFIIESLSQTSAEIRKGCFTRQMRHGKTGVGAVSSAFELITEMFAKLGDSGISFKMPEQVNKEKAWRIVAGWTKFRVAMGCDGTDKAEVDKGSEHPGHTALNGSIGADFHELFLEAVMR